MGAELSPEVAAAVDAVRPPQGLAAMRTGLHMAESLPTGLQPWSDYHAFRQRRVPVLFLSNGQNRRYHTPADDVDQVDYPKVAREAHYLRAIVAQLGAARANPTFVADGADYARDAQSMRAVLEGALATGGLVEQLGLSSTTRSRLQRDLNNVQGVQSALAGGAALNMTQIQMLRSASLRVMCHAGGSQTEATCNFAL
jgi:hypothetical protein